MPGACPAASARNAVPAARPETHRPMTTIEDQARKGASEPA